MFVTLLLSSLSFVPLSSCLLLLQEIKRATSVKEKREEGLGGCELKLRNLERFPSRQDGNIHLYIDTDLDTDTDAWKASVKVSIVFY